jgi:hypothetical protein
MGNNRSNWSSEEKSLKFQLSLEQSLIANPTIWIILFILTFFFFSLNTGFAVEALKLPM